MKLLGISGPLSERLASGEIDLAFSYGDAESFLALDRDTMRVSAGTDRFVCIMRPDHLALRADTFDLERYLELSHVAVSMSAKARSVVSVNLEALGKERRVIPTVTDARAAVRCVANSDLIATVAALGLARAFDVLFRGPVAVHADQRPALGHGPARVVLFDHHLASGTGPFERHRAPKGIGVGSRRAPPPAPGPAMRRPWLPSPRPRPQCRSGLPCVHPLACLSRRWLTSRPLLRQRTALPRSINIAARKGHDPAPISRCADMAAERAR